MEGLTTEVVEWVEFSEHFCFTQNEVHIFKIAVEKYTTQHSSRYTEILSEDEFAKALQFRQRKDTDRFLASRFALRTILSHFVAASPSEIQFFLSESRKPIVKDIHFNLSHSGDYILIAVGNIPLGIDIEYIMPDFETELLAIECFSKEEQSFLAAQGNRSLDFYTIWTRKESVLKATGEGLTDYMMDFNSLDIRVSRGSIDYSIRHGLIDEEYVWALSMLDTSATQHIYYWNY